MTFRKTSQSSSSTSSPRSRFTARESGKAATRSGQLLGVPGHLLPYRNAVGTQFGNVEPEIGGWIGVQTPQGFL